MRKIGLLGGMAWPSTVDCYRVICSGANACFSAAIPE
jgi:aspartate/glutamate racemase